MFLRIKTGDFFTGGNAQPTGMTLTHVLGCGIQKGNTQYYRGVEMDVTLLPKIKVEIIVSKVPVRTVIETAKKVLYTGHIGDGKKTASIKENETDYAFSIRL